jgi:hypothetical protein
MDVPQDQDWRYFYEELKPYNLTGREPASEFLIKFWQQKWQLNEEANLKCLKQYAKQLLAAYDQTPYMDRWDAFLPYTVLSDYRIAKRLLGDIYADQAKAFVTYEGANMPDIKHFPMLGDIYQQFIELKISNDVKVKKSLQKLAIDSLFGTQNFDNYFSEVTADGLLNSGLVHGDEINLEFNYPHFKQYFAAQFFIAHLDDNLVIEFILGTLLTDANYRGIWHFINDQFSTKLPSSHTKFERILYDKWLPNEKKFAAGFCDLSLVLYNVLELEFGAIYGFLFKILKRRPQILKKILLDVGDKPILKLGLMSLTPNGSYGPTTPDCS